MNSIINSRGGSHFTGSKLCNSSPQMLTKPPTVQSGFGGVNKLRLRCSCLCLLVSTDRAIVIFSPFSPVEARPFHHHPLISCVRRWACTGRFWQQILVWAEELWLLLPLCQNTQERPWTWNAEQHLVCEPNWGQHTRGRSEFMHRQHECFREGICPLGHRVQFNVTVLVVVCVWGLWKHMCVLYKASVYIKMWWFGLCPFHNKASLNICLIKG